MIECGTGKSSLTISAKPVEVWVGVFVRLVARSLNFRFTQVNRSFKGTGSAGDSNPEPTPLQSGTGHLVSKGARRTMLKIATG